MEISGTGISEDRIAALEKKCREIDAMVRGLLEELLDLKSISMKMPRQAGENSRQDLTGAPSVPAADSADGSTVIRPKSARQPDVPAEPAMVRIMQNDGTMKMEARCGDTKPIDSSRGYGRNRKGTSVMSKQNPLIYAADEDTSGPAKK